MSCHSWPPMPIITLGALPTESDVQAQRTLATCISFLILSQTIIGTGCPSMSVPAGAWNHGRFVSVCPVLPRYRGTGWCGTLNGCIQMDNTRQIYIIKTGRSEFWFTHFISLYSGHQWANTSIRWMGWKPEQAPSPSLCLYHTNTQ